MSRSGYDESDCFDQWPWIMWRGTVASALRGKRGQAFLKEMLTALDALENKRLVAEALVAGTEVCAMGAVAKARGIDMEMVDPEDPATVAGIFGIAGPMAQEIAYMNDEGGPHKETPEHRYQRMRKWIESKIKKETP